MPIGTLTSLCFVAKWNGIELDVRSLFTGEFFDLEALSDICASTKRYTFFFSSWPLNVYVSFFPILFGSAVALTRVLIH